MKTLKHRKDGRMSVQCCFRDCERGDKPFIPEGFIELDDERFKLIDEKVPIPENKRSGVKE